MNADDFARLRQSMIAEIAEQAIYVSARIGKAAFSQRVMEVMDKVPRHAFVPAELQQYAYANTPLPIGFDKTISQPFIVALMTDLLDIQPTDTVLEVGTGLGYQAAIVAALARKVYSVELIEELSEQASQRLTRLGFANVELKIGNGCSRLGRTCALRQGDRDRRAGPHSPTTHRSVEAWRQNGHSRRSARRSATHPDREGRAWKRHDEGHHSGPVFATRGVRAQRKRADRAIGTGRPSDFR